MLSESDKGDLDSPMGLPQDLASGDDYDALSGSSPLNTAKKGKGSSKLPKGERKKDKPWKSVAGADGVADSGLKLTVSPTGKDQREDDEDGAEEDGGSKRTGKQAEDGAGTEENEEAEEEDEKAREARRKAEEAAAAEAAEKAQQDAERA